MMTINGQPTTPHAAAALINLNATALRDKLRRLRLAARREADRAAYKRQINNVILTSLFALLAIVGVMAVFA